MLMWNIGRAPNNVSKWQMGFSSAFKGLIEEEWLHNLGRKTQGKKSHGRFGFWWEVESAGSRI